MAKLSHGPRKLEQNAATLADPGLFRTRLIGIPALKRNFERLFPSEKWRENSKLDFKLPFPVGRRFCHNICKIKGNEDGMTSGHKVKGFLWNTQFRALAFLAFFCMEYRDPSLMRSVEYKYN